MEKSGYERVGNEWFRCNPGELKAAIIAAKNKESMNPEREHNFSLRPEQKEAVDITSKYFKSYKATEKKTPHFLWNCKMRFGKTFSAYKLAQDMQWGKVLILTFKPAVENSWKEDIESHIDFKMEKIEEIEEIFKQIDKTEKNIEFIVKDEIIF